MEAFLEANFSLLQHFCLFMIGSSIAGGSRGEIEFSVSNLSCGNALNFDLLLLVKRYLLISSVTGKKLMSDKSPICTSHTVSFLQVAKIEISEQSIHSLFL